MVSLSQYGCLPSPEARDEGVLLRHLVLALSLPSFAPMSCWRADGSGGRGGGGGGESRLDIFTVLRGTAVLVNWTVKFSQACVPKQMFKYKNRRRPLSRV